ncbi:MAG: hypothetical protein ACREKH_06935, partial [Candidatus Rokuibacteriota bacterium]
MAVKGRLPLVLAATLAGLVLTIRYASACWYTFLTLAAHAVNMLTAFSTLPLRFASLLGLVITVFGVGVLAFAVGRYLWAGTTAPGLTLRDDGDGAAVRGAGLGLGILRLPRRPGHRDRDSTSTGRGRGQRAWAVRAVSGGGCSAPSAPWPRRAFTRPRT